MQMSNGAVAVKDHNKKQVMGNGKGDNCQSSNESLSDCTLRTSNFKCLVSMRC